MTKPPRAAYALVAGALFLVTATELSAQFGRGMASLRGQVKSDEDSPFSPVDWQVELRSFGTQSPPISAITSPTGDFDFEGVEPGDYHLRVLNRTGQVLKETMVHVGDSFSFVTVRLRTRPEGDHPISGRVSLQQLGHKVPKGAVKEFRRAMTAAQQQNSTKAILHLKKALEIDPAFLAAYNNLGAQYIRTQQFDQALAQFQKARAVDEHSPAVAVNLGIAYMTLGRPAQAEKAAREAVRLDSTSNGARYVLGLALVAQHKNGEEALESLEAAGRELPIARLAAAELLASQGHSEQAAAQLRQYLQSDGMEARSQVKAWLARLEQAEKAGPSALRRAP